MKKIKIASALIAAILATTLVIQNTGVVETRLLFFTLKLPGALLYALFFASGLIVGLFIAMSLSGNKSGKV